MNTDIVGTFRITPIIQDNYFLGYRYDITPSFISLSSLKTTILYDYLNEPINLDLNTHNNSTLKVLYDALLHNSDQKILEYGIISLNIPMYRLIFPGYLSAGMYRLVTDSSNETYRSSSDSSNTRYPFIQQGNHIVCEGQINIRNKTKSNIVTYYNGMLSQILIVTQHSCDKGGNYKVSINIIFDNFLKPYGLKKIKYFDSVNGYINHISTSIKFIDSQDTATYKISLDKKRNIKGVYFNWTHSIKNYITFTLLNDDIDYKLHEPRKITSRSCKWREPPLIINNIIFHFINDINKDVTRNPFGITSVTIPIIDKDDDRYFRLDPFNFINGDTKTTYEFYPKDSVLPEGPICIINKSNDILTSNVIWSINNKFVPYPIYRAIFLHIRQTMFFYIPVSILIELIWEYVKYGDQYKRYLKSLWNIPLSTLDLSHVNDLLDIMKGYY